MRPAFFSLLPAGLPLSIIRPCASTKNIFAWQFANGTSVSDWQILYRRRFFAWQFGNPHPGENLKKHFAGSIIPS
jgi:hypothetical protein